MQPYEKLKQIAEIHADNYAASLDLAESGTASPKMVFLDGFYAALQLVGVKVKAEIEQSKASVPSGSEFTPGDYTLGMNIPHVYSR